MIETPSPSARSTARPATATWAYWLVCAGLLLASLAPRPAAAQDYSPEDLEEFKRLLGSATRSYDAGRYRRALTSLKEARQLIDHPRIAYRLARVYEKLNRCDDARGAYRRFIDSGRISEDQRTNAEGQLDGLDARCKSTGQLSVTCQPEGARLIVGEQQVLCPANLTLDAGDYTAVVRASGHRTKTLSVTVPPGGRVSESVSLEADERTRRRDETEEKFEEQMQRAHEAFDAGQFEEALEAFNRADSLLERPHVTYQQALTYEQLHRCADAERAYTEFLAEDEVDEALRDRAQRRLRSIDERCTNDGTLTITCRPESTRLHINDEQLTCPAALQLEADTYRIAASADGHRSVSFSVTIEAGQTTDKRVSLEPTSGSKTEPRANPVPETDSGGGLERAAPWVVAGVGAGLLAGGVVSDATAVQRTDQLQQSDTPLSELRQQADRARVRTIVLYSGGASLFVGGIIWKLASLSGSDDTTDDGNATGPRLRPTVGPRAAGFHLRW